MIENVLIKMWLLELNVMHQTNNLCKKVLFYSSISLLRVWNQNLRHIWCYSPLLRWSLLRIKSWLCRHSLHCVVQLAFLHWILCATNLAAS